MPQYFQGGKVLPVVAAVTFAALRACDPTYAVDGAMAAVLPAIQGGVPGSTAYHWESASTLADDGNVVVKPDALGGGSPGRWIASNLNAPHVRATQDAVANGTNDGLHARNTTAPSLGASQWSPLLKLSGGAWNSFTNAALTDDWALQGRPQSFFGTVSRLAFLWQSNGGGYQSLLALTQDGRLFFDAASLAVLSQDALAGTGGANAFALSIIGPTGQAATGVAANSNGGDVWLKGGIAGVGGSGAAGIAGGVTMFQGSAQVARAEISNASALGAQNYLNLGTLGGLRGTQLLSVATGGVNQLVASTTVILGTVAAPTAWTFSATGVTAAIGLASVTYSQTTSTTTGTAAATTFSAQTASGIGSTGGAMAISAGGGDLTGGGLNLASGPGGTIGAIQLLPGGSTVGSLAMGSALIALDGNGGNYSLQLQKPNGTGVATAPDFIIKGAQGKNVSSGTNNNGGNVQVRSGDVGTGGSAGAAGEIDFYSGTSTLIAAIRATGMQILVGVDQWKEATDAFAATTVMDLSAGNVHNVTLTGNITTLTLNNQKAGAVYVLRFIQDVTGSRTLAIPSNMKVAGNAFTLTTGKGNCRDQIILCSDGTKLYECGRAMNIDN